MDATELARRAAASLHDGAVAAGRDPRYPLAFATAIAESLGYAVEDASPGAARLDGGRATVIADDALIVHEAAGTPFDRAFLVAHEIGHVATGDVADGAVVAEARSDRPSEDAPGGAQRVLDYGRRQRREVRMDLFARELILPRPVARAMHVTLGMTASAIAAERAVPFAVVAQQLLDALLLPTHEGGGAPRPPPDPNDRQREAARHDGPPCLVEAGPGTGKTRTLAARVEHLLSPGRDVDPRRILALTFSNKAAGELVDRLARTRPDAVASMWVGTFHAFGLDLLRVFGREIGLAPDVRLLDRVEAAELLEGAFPGLRLVHHREIHDPTQTILDMLAAFSRAQDEVAGPERYAQCARAMLAAAGADPGRVEAAERAMEVAIAYAAYEDRKRAAGAIDLGDLARLPVELLEGRREVAEIVRGRYDHVLVDEFQDVNRANLRLVRALVAGGASLWAVGDPKQSIYRFRGASSYNVARFGGEDFPGGVRRRLDVNYRSSEEIAAAFSAFAARMGVTTGDAALRAARGPSGVRPALVLHDTTATQSAAIVEGIGAARRRGGAWRDQAVLCTGNERLAAIAADLERAGVPVLFLGSLFERPEIRDLLAILSILADPRGSGLVRTAGTPAFAMTMPDVLAALDALEGNDGDASAALRRLEPMSTNGGVAARALADALDGFDETSRPWEILAALLLDRTRAAASIAADGSIADRAKGIAIWQFMSFVHAQPTGAGPPVRRLLDRIRRLVRLADDREVRQMPAAAQELDAVRLMTVHGAKGLEFDVVHLPGLNADTIPRTSAPPACPPPVGLVEGMRGDVAGDLARSREEEAQCLFYVAMSRARDRLVLYAARRTTNGRSRPLSSFLHPIAGLIDEKSTAVASPAGGEVAVPVDPGGGLTFHASQLALYASCPRRFLYTHLLRIGGRRVSTPYAAAHDVVASMVRRIVGGEAAAIGDIRGEVIRTCREAGLDEARHGDHVAIAVRLVARFVEGREGSSTEPPPTLRVGVGPHAVVFQPDDVVVDAAGVRRLRRIRTGHYRAADLTDLWASALGLAAPESIVEIVHLSDGTVTPLPPRRGDGGRKKIEAVFAGVAGGRFPAAPSSRVCPGCPAFFVCGPLPAGVVKKRR